MKKRLNVPQLNNKTIVKLLIFIAIVVVVELVTAIAIFYQVSTKTYKYEYSVYNDRASSLSVMLENNYSVEQLNSLNNQSVQQDVLDTCKANGGFQNYVITVMYDGQTGGRVVTSDVEGIEADKEFSEIGIVNNAVSVAKVGDKNLLFAPISVGTSGYGVVGVIDFSESQKAIDGLMGNTIAFLIVGGVLVAAAFIGYAYALVNKDNVNLFRYKLTLSKSGKIISKNKAFKDDFSTVGEIVAPEKLIHKQFSLVPLPTTNGEEGMVALRAINVRKGIKVYGGKVNNAQSFMEASSDSNNSAAMSTMSLSTVFESFVKKGKRTLIGVLLIGNLDQIKTLFGKQTALDVQNIILNKVKEKFTYAFELDFGYLGIAYPDGKKLDIIMTDLNDIFNYINEPLKVDVNLFTLDMKGGFAMCDETMNPRTFDHAFKAAEAARQRAIDTKVADYIVYHESQQKLYTSYLFTFDIKQMLSEDAFEMEYQPQYSIKEARVEGFEALFRVKKSWNVNVDTFSFITYAERTGAMIQLGDFIFDTGMKFAKSIEGKNVSVSLNVSPVQLMQAGFIDSFLRLYRKYDLKPGAICVEITESFLMTNFAETLKKLTVLTQQGILVHLDDFGTEYSSLLYIKKLPISTIKIDKEFVKDVLESRESQAIIKFITNIAKLLNGTTICEGVETVKEFDMLNYLGCDTIQGWLISRSLKPDDAARFIDEFDYKQVVAAQQAKQ
ncbi:MAG: EAL domain-containing protein [Candidatus Coproplasma sp.]